MSSKPNVVVLGGGVGAQLARELSGKLDASKVNLTLIDARPYRVHLIAMARILVTDEGHLEKDALAAYDKLFINGNGQFVQARATGVETEEGGKSGDVVLEGGRRIRFDILVLAPGSKWPGALQLPDDAAEATNIIKQSRDSFKSAKKVVIAGAGAVGLEIAGEIKDTYPNTQVTIVHGGKQVMNATYPDKFRRKLEKGFEARGIEFVFEDYIDDFPSAEELKATGHVTTRNGKQIKADLVVKSTGPVPATEFLSSSSSSFGSDVLTAQGHIAVRSTLQLRDYPNIFALGDAIDWKEQKQAAKAANHLKILVQNIPAFIAGKTLKEYGGSPELLAVTNGKGGGAMYAALLWGIMVGDWVVSAMKSKTLFIPMFKDSMGL